MVGLELYAIARGLPPCYHCCMFLPRAIPFLPFFGRAFYVLARLLKGRNRIAFFVFKRKNYWARRKPKSLSVFVGE